MNHRRRSVKPAQQVPRSSGIDEKLRTRSDPVRIRNGTAKTGGGRGHEQNDPNSESAPRNQHQGFGFGFGFGAQAPPDGERQG